MRSKLNNWLIIAGNGRNVGKTWLAEYCIQQLAFQYDVISLKIASHIHKLSADIKWIDGDQDNWMLGKETNRHSLKDSGRMLAAGASHSYYAQLKSDQYIPEILSYLNGHIKEDQIVICESAAIGQFIIPGLAFFVQDSKLNEKTCIWDFEYLELHSEHSRITNLPKSIKWDKSNWTIN